MEPIIAIMTALIGSMGDSVLQSGLAETLNLLRNEYEELKARLLDEEAHASSLAIHLDEEHQRAEQLARERCGLQAEVEGVTRLT